ncbi:MAG: hypothetical protein EAX89_17560 [Candidatus Lokiarchaeota archaeon]|nr:hypothetical protein [Candidatus Lokiarchaeota archaeon]
MSEEKSTPAAKPVKTEWQHASWVSQLGKWAWIWGIINGLIDVIWGLYSVFVLALIPYGYGVYGMGTGIWLIISGIIAVFISFVIIKPKVSNKCVQKDWDHFYNWVWKLGSFRFPFVLFWGIVLEVFGYGWGGVPVIIIAIMLIFLGPKEYKWSE